MERHRNDPEYQLHEPAKPHEDDERLSAEEFEERSIERENSPWAVQQRQNTNRPPPSEVRELYENDESREGTDGSRE